ncbi:MAG TPA: iron uptake transporter deferrochelatase/peroxidase subunit [Mycobacteriales bacterium]|jgi:deferrochelatase/peroxidase EfeB|nr:iron uptake transporter deferrochelatase/peroxidase subunit [Mycobacteriales bacterium]
MTPETAPAPDPGGVSRRRALGMLGVGAAAVGAGAALRVGAASAAPPPPDTFAFYGPHQAGIVSPVQGHLHFAAYDVTTTDRTALVLLLRKWTEAAAAMTEGREVGSTGALGGPALAPPQDTGEALGHPASRLTITFGFGPSLFDGRFGLADRRPPALADLPAFAGDTLDPQRSNGDLCIQACADDPQVAVHAIRNLSRLAAGAAAVRWAQLGFGRAATTSTAEQTPRNLFGFKDGTANVLADDTAALDEHVWAAPGDGAAWMAGGSYLVGRQIRMLIETWDRSSLREQEQIIGRDKGEGAPLGSRRERDEVVPTALPRDSHVRLSHPSMNGGARLLRRGYNFVEGSDGLGHLDAGLFFLAYQRDPRKAFVPIQRRLSRDDTLNEYIRHTGSSVWAVPPGVQPGQYVGQPLFT